MVLIDETIYFLGVRFKLPFQIPCDFPDGKMAVECYDEETDIWNDRTTTPIDKICLRGRSFRLGREFVFTICSLRLLKVLNLITCNAVMIVDLS